MSGEVAGFSSRSGLLGECDLCLMVWLVVAVVGRVYQGSVVHLLLRLRPVGYVGMGGWRDQDEGCGDHRAHLVQAA